MGDVYGNIYIHASIQKIFQGDVDLKAQIFRDERDILWSVICGFLNNLSEKEIRDAKEYFCNCVNSIIEAYENEAREVKFWKNLLKKTTMEKNKKIKQLEHRVSELTKQLASKVCETCGKKGITEQFRSLSVQQNTNKVIIRCRVVRHQNFLL